MNRDRVLITVSLISLVFARAFPWESVDIWKVLVDIICTYIFSDIKSLHCNELWSLESQEGVGRITNLVGNSELADKVNIDLVNN